MHNINHYFMFNQISWYTFVSLSLQSVGTNQNLYLGKVYSQLADPQNQIQKINSIYLTKSYFWELNFKYNNMVRLLCKIWQLVWGYSLRIIFIFINCLLLLLLLLSGCCLCLQHLPLLLFNHFHLLSCLCWREKRKKHWKFFLYLVWDVNKLNENNHSTYQLLLIIILKLTFAKSSCCCLSNSSSGMPRFSKRVLFLLFLAAIALQSLSTASASAL